MKKLLCLALALLFLGVGTARADGAQIYVCTGCTTPPGGDPNVINPASINVGFAGDHTAVSPLLIIVGVPNAGPAPTISLPNGVSPAAASTYYGLNFATTGTTAGKLEGTLLNVMGVNAYMQSGLTTGSGGGDSENASNWFGFDIANGFTTSGATFNLYAYAIDFALKSGAGGNSPITIDFTGINAGSFVIAYNCAVGGSTCTDGNIGETPFTNAGVVPEPGTLALFGTGLLGLAAAIRRRLRG